MTTPLRIQRRRTKGWKMPANTLYVGRPSKFGNPFTIAGCRDAGYRGDDAAIASRCVSAFSAWLTGPYWRENWDGAASEKCRAIMITDMPDLRGKNLACWCRLCPAHPDGKPMGVECAECEPCHVDHLLKISNR